MTKTRRSAAQSVGSVRRVIGGARGVLAVGLLALGGCGDLQPVTSFEPETDGAKLFGSLTLDHRAINLSTEAPYDTIQLTARPRNLQGEPLEGLPAPMFRSSDTASVWVTPEGLVQARKVASGVQVIAEVVTGDNVRHADTAYVKVTSTATPHELASLEITFAAPEQAELPMSTQVSEIVDMFFMIAGQPSPTARAVSVVALDGAGNSVPRLEIDYVSLDPDNVEVDRRTGVVEQVNGPPGEVTIIARTAAYGVVRADTATFIVVGPVANGYAIQQGSDGAPVFSNSEVVIRPGGYVGWVYMARDGAPIGIPFEDPTGVEGVPELCATLGGFMPHFCEDGDIIAFVGSDSDLFEMVRFRQFPEPGVYEFETTDGVQGRVRVVADDDSIWDAMRSGQ